MPTRRFVLGFDGSHGADAAIDWCADIAPVLDAEVAVVAEMLLGSVPHALAHHSNRPLVVVPLTP